MWNNMFRLLLLKLIVVNYLVKKFCKILILGLDFY